jgi:hypothetical protein
MVSVLIFKVYARKFWGQFIFLLIFVMLKALHPFGAEVMVCGDTILSLPTWAPNISANAA